MHVVKLVIDFRCAKRLGRRMESRTHHDLVQRLVLHAGVLAETLATDAARMPADDLGNEAGRRLAETGRSIALLTEAAFALLTAVEAA